MIDALQWLITFVLAVASWFFADSLDFRWKIIIALAILLLSCALGLLRSHTRIKAVSKELEDVRERHKAVSARFDEKRTDLARHQAALQSLEYSIVIATQSSSRNKLNILYEQLQKIKSSITNEGGG